MATDYCYGPIKQRSYKWKDLSGGERKRWYRGDKWMRARVTGYPK